MTQEKKDLLLKDLCARLPYGVRVKLNGRREKSNQLTIDWLYAYSKHIEDIKPYLRPMASMSEEEKKEYELLANHCIVTSIGFIHLEAAPLTDWLNKKMFDYRGLIHMGLALPATEGMYQ